MASQSRETQQLSLRHRRFSIHKRKMLIMFVIGCAISGALAACRELDWTF